MQEGSLFFTLSPAFIVGRILYDGHSDWLRGYFIVVLIHISLIIGFLGDTVVKNLPANAGDAGSIPGLRRSPEGENGNPTQRSLVVYRVTESETMEHACTDILQIFCRYFPFCFVYGFLCYTKAFKFQMFVLSILCFQRTSSSFVIVVFSVFHLYLSNLRYFLPSADFEYHLFFSVLVS